MSDTFVTLRYAVFWWLLGAALVALVVYGSLATGGPVMTITVWDKLQHLVAYGVLGVYFSGLVTPRAYRWLFSALLLLSLLLEWLQQLGGLRQFDWGDVLSNAIGLLMALVLSFMGLRHWSRITERILA